MKNITISLIGILVLFSCNTIPKTDNVPLTNPVPIEKPREQDFSITVLDQILEEPMEMDIFNDGRILFIERVINISIIVLIVMVNTSFTMIMVN